MEELSVSMRWLGIIVMAALFGACRKDEVPPPPPPVFKIKVDVEGFALAQTCSLILQNQGEQISVYTDGLFEFPKEYHEGSRYDVTVVSKPPGYDCSILGGRGSILGDQPIVKIRCVPTFVFESQSPQAAQILLGQNNSDSDVSPKSLRSPAGNPILADQRLFIPDTNENRVVIFEGLAVRDLTSGADAVDLIGAGDLNESPPSQADQQHLIQPHGGASNGTWVAVADMLNNRVLLYKRPVQREAKIPVSANWFFGQDSFRSNEERCEKNRMIKPEGVALTKGKLVVADTGNNRVLIWNRLPDPDKEPCNNPCDGGPCNEQCNGGAPDIILGQDKDNECAANKGKPKEPNEYTLSAPSGVWTDGDRLLVVDRGNNRVLIWNSFPEGADKPADRVLGQTAFTLQDVSSLRNGLSGPSSVVSIGEQIFVADSGNHRLMVWNSFPNVNGGSADFIMSYDGVKSPSGILLAFPYLVVTDPETNHAFIFQSEQAKGSCP